jgi:hypothetical protein
MKKVLALLAVVLAMTITSAAQTSSSAAGQSDQTTPSKSKASASKAATMTGCISAQPDASGNYTLSNDQYKQGVKIGPADKVKEHAGHQVTLNGQWSDAGGDKSFDVASVKHISPTCANAGAQGAASKDDMAQKK